MAIDTEEVGHRPVRFELFETLIPAIRAIDLVSNPSLCPNASVLGTT
jgi:hypothetical protein